MYSSGERVRVRGALDVSKHNHLRRRLTKSMNVQSQDMTIVGLKAQLGSGVKRLGIKSHSVNASAATASPRFLKNPLDLAPHPNRLVATAHSLRLTPNLPILSHLPLAPGPHRRSVGLRKSAQSRFTNAPRNRRSLTLRRRLVRIARLMEQPTDTIPGLLQLGKPCSAAPRSSSLTTTRSRLPTSPPSSRRKIISSTSRRTNSPRSKPPSPSRSI